MAPGSLTGAGEWVEAHSMARAIEQSMVTDGILSLDDETEDAMKQRRKAMIALARGIITHLTAQTAVAVTVPIAAINPGVPTAVRTLSGTVS
jgi:hypothetical protein